MKWQDKLNSREHKHLKETGATTLKQLRELRQAQRIIADGAGAKELCWDCRSIAITLGLEA